MTVNKAITSLIMLIFDSFHCLVLSLTYLTTASRITPSGCISMILALRALYPSYFSFHFLESSRFSTISGEKVSKNLASASSLLRPSPIFSSYMDGPFAPPAVAAGLAAGLAGPFFSSSFGFWNVFFTGAYSSFISSSSAAAFAKRAGGPFFGAEDGGGPPKASSPKLSRL